MRAGAKATRTLLEEKKAKLLELSKMSGPAPAYTALLPEIELEAATTLYDRYGIGEFGNLKRNRFRWIAPGPKWTGPDLFEFIPKATRPFQFIPPNGRPITPRNMITDVGTIPRAVGVFLRGLTPWGYAPAYIVHDWEFERHHCGDTKSFEAVRDTMMQAVKTLMERKLAPKSLINFWLLYQAINSRIAKDYWNRKPPKCTLPPDDPE